MKGFFLFRWIGEFFNFIWRLVLTTLIFLLYALQISRFAFDGRSSSFISLYYLLILSLPVLIKNLVRKNLHARILSLLFLPCQLILLFWLFGGVLDLLTIIWVAITTILFLLREAAKKDYAFSSVAIPYLTLALCAYLLFTTLYEKDYLFWNVGKGCKNVVYFAEMSDVSDKVKEISESREYFVLNDKICVLGEGKYDFRLRPIYNKCFSQGIYKCQTTADLEETVFEIQYVSSFKAHRARNYAVGFGEGVVKTAWDQFSSLVNMVIHPIDTLIGLWKAVKHLVSTLFSSPLDLIPSPAKMLSEHLDEIGDKIAAANNIDKDRIILPETLQVIKEQRILYLAGEIGLVVAEIAVPLPKVGVSEKMSALGVSMLKRLGIAKKGGEVVKLPHPYIKPPNKLTRELEKVAEREAADVGDRVVTKGIEDIRPYPSARLPQEVTRELEKAAEREAADVGDRVVTKGIEDIRGSHPTIKPSNEVQRELDKGAGRKVGKSEDGTVTPKEKEGSAKSKQASNDEGITKKEEQARKNRDAGAEREAQATRELEKRFPKSKGYKIHKQVVLRDKNGHIVKDPVTGEARRIDFVVEKDGKIVKSYEVTSETAPKGGQLAKEKRIRDAGGNYIRNEETGQLVYFPPSVQTEVWRMP